MKKTTDKRFIEVSSEGTALGVQKKVFVDRETGVEYLFMASGYAGGLTVMLDRDGRPKVRTLTNLED